MSASLTVSSPAKVNLYLAVAGKRPDGFHDLVSLVAPVKFGDEIKLTIGGDFTGVALSCDDPAVPEGTDNIAVRAARAFREATGTSDGVSIALTKRIPMGAGLGGGSSNAAAVLRGLNELYDSPLSQTELSSLAAGLGSDCPLFLAGGPCVIRGRGEIVEPVDELIGERLKGLPVFIFKPDFSINTGWAYNRLASTRTVTPAKEWAKIRLHNWLREGTAVEDLLFNSFEEVVFKKFVSLPVIMERLTAEPSVTGRLLSGSGSACFVILDPANSPTELENIVRDCLGESAFCQLTALA